MNLFDFKLLGDTEKLEILYRCGVYVGKRRKEHKTVLLYQLEGFYVELFYQKHRCVVSHLYCFSSALRIDPYLDQVNVEAIILTK
ncbi:MAG: hypothetical protein V4676_05105 [Bacteroidota bacterium]